MRAGRCSPAIPSSAGSVAVDSLTPRFGRAVPGSCGASPARGQLRFVVARAARSPPHPPAAARAGKGPAREAVEASAWPLERPMEESPSALVWSTQEPLVVFNLADDPRYRAAFRLLLDNGVRSCCILPLTTAHRRLGAVGFGYARPHNYFDADVEFLGQVARQIAVAVDNVLAHEEAGELQAALAEERDRLRLLLDLNNTLT